MTFKLLDNKSSVLKKNTRYVQGGDTDIFPNSLGWWEKRDDILTDQIDDIFFPISKTYEKRPDLISYAVYGRADLTWLVLQYNNIVDINTELVAGVTISLPSQVRTYTDILTKSIPTQQ